MKSQKPVSSFSKALGLRKLASRRFAISLVWSISQATVPSLFNLVSLAQASPGTESVAEIEKQREAIFKRIDELMSPEKIGDFDANVAELASLNEQADLLSQILSARRQEYITALTQANATSAVRSGAAAKESQLEELDFYHRYSSQQIQYLEQDILGEFDKILTQQLDSKNQFLIDGNFTYLKTPHKLDKTAKKQWNKSLPTLRAEWEKIKTDSILKTLAEKKATLATFRDELERKVVNEESIREMKALNEELKNYQNEISAQAHEFNQKLFKAFQVASVAPSLLSKTEKIYHEIQNATYLPIGLESSEKDSSRAQYQSWFQTGLAELRTWLEPETALLDQFSLEQFVTQFREKNQSLKAQLVADLEEKTQKTRGREGKLDDLEKELTQFVIQTLASQADSLSHSARKRQAETLSAQAKQKVFAQFNTELKSLRKRSKTITADELDEKMLAIKDSTTQKAQDAREEINVAVRKFQLIEALEEQVKNLVKGFPKASEEAVMILGQAKSESSQKLLKIKADIMAAPANEVQEIFETASARFQTSFADLSDGLLNPEKKQNQSETKIAELNRRFAELKKSVATLSKNLEEKQSSPEALTSKWVQELNTRNRARLDSLSRDLELSQFHLKNRWFFKAGKLIEAAESRLAESESETLYVSTLIDESLQFEFEQSRILKLAAALDSFLRLELWKSVPEIQQLQKNVDKTYKLSPKELLAAGLLEEQFTQAHLITPKSTDFNQTGPSFLQGLIARKQASQKWLENTFSSLELMGELLAKLRADSLNSETALPNFIDDLYFTNPRMEFLATFSNVSAALSRVIDSGLAAELRTSWRHFGESLINPMILQTVAEPTASTRITRGLYDVNLGDFIDSMIQVMEQDQPVFRRGLENYGSTCYLNSVVKALATTRLRYLFHPASPELPRSEETEAEFEDRKLLKNHIWHLLSGITQKDANLQFQNERQSFSELQNSTVNAIRNILVQSMPALFAAPDWKHNQQDAEEFLHGILSQFQSDPNAVNSTLIKETSALRNNAKPEIESIIRLPLKDRGESLESAFKRHLSSESLKFVKAPDTLILQLGRFGYETTQEGEYRAIKIAHPVIPNVTLSAPMATNPNSSSTSNVTYRLKGVVAHVGDSPNAGHYIYFETRFSKRLGASGYQADGVWIHNDTSVVQESGFGSLENLRSRPEFEPLFYGSYLYFYEKVDAGIAGNSTNNPQNTTR